jgi:hypothetical protein
MAKDKIHNAFHTEMDRINQYKTTVKNILENLAKR